MTDPFESQPSALAPKLAAPQHKPRPLTLFLDLVRRDTDGHPERMAQVLAGLRAYQEAERPPLPEPRPVLREIMGATLRDYGGEGPTVIFIPSLINPPNVLDLMPDWSLLRWLTGHGHHVLLLDWGWDVASRRTLSIAGHIEQIILPFIDALDEPPLLVGYCLGGTMALGAAAAAKVRAVATIAGPWQFGGFPDDARQLLARLWLDAGPAVAALGLLPMELLQAAFWNLDPARTVAKFERIAGSPPGSAEVRSFVALEDWANDGPPLPEAAARELFEGFFRDDLPGGGRWQVAGAAVDPAVLPCPLLNIVSTIDRIVPAASAVSAGERLNLDQGHVGMVIGSRAREQLWQPLAAWLAAASAKLS